jgi:RNase P subunit RPR2
VDEERSGNSTSASCRSCGNDERTDDSRDDRYRTETFQVIVACAACGAAFAALSRN